jgi:gliding motility-associated-like protein
MASDFSSITWIEVNGGAAPTPNNTLVTDAPAAGEYELTLVSAINGCDTTATVTVEEDTEAPIAAADTNMDPDDNNIGCDGNALSVGGTATSTGPEFSYLWTVLSGSGTIAAPTDAQTSVDDEGSYILTVLNETNFCTSSDTIFVTAEVDLPLAELGADTTICEMEYVLSANLPTGATGTWTSADGDIIDPADPNTTVMDLQTGDNIFTWTLTSPGCPDYSTASVVISVPDAPTANNDIVEIDETEEMETIVAVSNDLIQNNFSFNITTDPTRGQIDSIDAATGTIYYSIKPGEFGPTTIVYKICDEDCETLCDEATIDINIIRRDVEFDIANGITMNNDGVNDALIFDQLLNNPDAFENNELIIFNRWGDIVYQAAPYNNDWTGVNENGEELPEGTYYYILRLSIPRGEIIRGDVTIVK